MHSLHWQQSIEPAGSQDASHTSTLNPNSENLPGVSLHIVLQCPGWGRNYNISINSSVTDKSNSHKHRNVYAFWLMMWWVLAGQVLSIQHACTATPTLSAKGPHCWGSCLPMISPCVCNLNGQCPPLACRLNRQSHPFASIASAHLPA